MKSEKSGRAQAGAAPRKRSTLRYPASPDGVDGSDELAACLRGKRWRNSLCKPAFWRR